MSFIKQFSNPAFAVLQVLMVWGLLGIFSAPAYSQVMLNSIGGSFPLFNGQDTSAWTRSGNANWSPTGNGVSANQGSGMLISRFSFTDYQIQFEYWVDESTEFSILTHCADPNYIAQKGAVEVNLSNYPKQLYGAGSVVGMIKAPNIQVMNQWNKVIISSQSNKISVTLNGVTIANKMDYPNFSSGPFAIGFGGGNLKIANFTAIIPGRW